MHRRTEVSIVDPRTERASRISFRHPWLRRWMHMAHAIGNVWAWVLFSLFYLIIITPVGAFYRFAADPLRIRVRKPSWQPFSRQHDNMREATLQS